MVGDCSTWSERDHQHDPALHFNQQSGFGRRNRIMKLNPTMLLGRQDIAALMSPADYLDAVRTAFRAGKTGSARSPAPLHIPSAGGGFHAKGAFLDVGRKVVAVKLNGNFPDNPRRYGLPTIQGAILLCDAENGALLAILDSIEITLRRTAAASALAATYLARPDASTLTLCGCGGQAAAQAEALAAVLPIKRGFTWDIDTAQAARLAKQLSKQLGFRFEAVSELDAATRPADVIVTCTTAKRPFLNETHVSPGTFVAAVGADSPEKSEIAPPLMAKAKVVADVITQCCQMGDLHHALQAGAMTADNVYCDLGDLAAELTTGRQGHDDIFIFDSTGTALQDVTSACVAYERAKMQGYGHPFHFA
jgi:ornithine cyclodeaminase/alanine dehydrogenase-like protein (mu-crystallin family)